MRSITARKPFENKTESLVVRDRSSLAFALKNMPTELFETLRRSELESIYYMTQQHNVEEKNGKSGMENELLLCQVKDLLGSKFLSH